MGNLLTTKKIERGIQPEGAGVCDAINQDTSDQDSASNPISLDDLQPEVSTPKRVYVKAYVKQLIADCFININRCSKSFSLISPPAKGPLRS